MSDKPPKEVQRRILTSFQSTGRIGRSTLKQGLMSWFSFAGIEFTAIDADPEHHTLSSWYPDITNKMPYRDEQDLLPILNTVGDAAAVELIDFPSQETQSILKAFDHFNAFKLFESKNTRLTVFIFASDERPAFVSAHQILTAFDSNADYIIVENAARFSSKTFYNSVVLQDILKGFKAPTIEVPRITEATLGELDDASRRKKKALTFREGEPLLPIGSKFELEAFRNKLFVQFEDVSHLLLPSPDLIKQRTERVKARKLVAVNPYDL